MSGSHARGRAAGWALGVPLVLFLVLPLAVLVLSTTPSELRAALRHPSAMSAIVLSARTTVVSLAIIVAGGLPLAWRLAHARHPIARVIETLVELPIVVPPAVVGVALLQTYGRRGAFGPLLDGLGISVPFTTAAVITAQVVVAAPFFVQSATNAFRRVDADQILVARTLGATHARAFFRVAIPAAVPGLLGGAAMAWARALGEFGATLFFAGSLPGRTQTMPLAIFSALEGDLALARALALLLAVAAFAVLVTLRLLPALRDPEAPR